jgi:hypothetical protein
VHGMEVVIVPEFTQTSEAGMPLTSRPKILRVAVRPQVGGVDGVPIRAGLKVEMS